MAIYSELSPDAVRQMAARADVSLYKQNKDETLFALDYLENRQLERVRQELATRYSVTMALEPGQSIQPVAFPLTERYVSEAATAYSKKPVRYLVDENGEETEETKEQTKRLNDFLGEADYDEVMHLNEKHTNLLRSSCVFYEAKRGKLRASVKYSADVTPIKSSSDSLIDATDPEDYDAFVVLLDGDSSQVNLYKSENLYAFITNYEIQFWKGNAPNKLTKFLSSHKNPYMWEQVQDLEDDSGIVSSKKELPGRMLTFWHTSLSIDCLLPKVECLVASLNQEFNIAWAAILDTIKMQGYSIPVLRLNDKANPKAQMRYGARFPLVLGLEESFDLVSSATNFTEQVQALQSLLQMFAILSRQSGAEYSLGGSAQSGFAKLVEKLPTLESRQERITRLTAMETKEAWPRIRSIGQMLGALDKSTSNMRLVARFAEVNFPLSQQERATKITTDLTNNLTTPSKILAQEQSMSAESAQAEVESNKEENAQPMQPQEPSIFRPLGTKVGMPSRG